MIYLSPIGEIVLTSDGEFLRGLWFLNSPDDNGKDLKDYIENEKVFEDVIKWLDIYFSHQIPNFTPKYRLENSTPFRKSVIDELNKIPYGKVATYNDIAKSIAKKQGLKKMSAQAVGGAVGWNPICIIIPCHRVVGSNGSLTGYAGGIDNKIKLLEIEGNNMNKFYIPKKGTKL